MKPALVLAGLVVCLSALPVHADAVALQVSKTANPGEVRLTWSGGVPTYTVYRGANASTVTQPANEVGTTSGAEFLDTPPGTVAFFVVASPCTAGPPAVCCLTDGACLASEFCEPSSSTCATKKTAGAVCGGPNQCQSGFCVDGVCCTNGCTGTCRVCNMSGIGSCTSSGNGTDPDAECGDVSCDTFYFGFVGDTCYRKADVTASQATCNGAGACRTQAQECAAQTAQGSPATVCHMLCQDPTPGTCTGTTAGTCTNVNPGTQTCGIGACQVTMPRCINGTPGPCFPNPPLLEQCNDIDDNCDGTVDNGNFLDGLEFNDTCANARVLVGVPEGGSNVVTNANLSPPGDQDVYRIDANEIGSNCACCDGGSCLDEDFRLTVSLTVPAEAGSYEVCLSAGAACTGTWTNCTTVLAGASGSINTVRDGSCAGNDTTFYFVRVRGVAAPGGECRAYTLAYGQEEGCFP